MKLTGLKVNILKRISLSDILVVIIFQLFSLCPFYFTAGSSGNGFFASVDGRLPYYPEKEVEKIWSVFNSSISYGMWDTGWTFFSKSLPIYITYSLTNNLELSLKVYLSFLIFSVMLGMYFLLRDITKFKFISVPLAIFWGYQVMVKNYLITTPNIILAYAGAPLFYSGLISIINKPNKKTSVVKLLVGLLLLISGDISYSAVTLGGGIIIIIAKIFKVKRNFKDIFYQFTKVSVLFLLLSQIFLSGLIVGSLYADYSSYVNNDYTKGVISSLPRSADVLSTLKLSTGQGDPRTAFDFISAYITVSVLIFAFILGFKRPIIRAAVVFGLIGFIMAAGFYLPYWETFYTYFYSIPFTSLVRNMFKFSFLYLISVFICSAFVLNYSVENIKNKLVSIFFAFVVFTPMLNGAYKFLTIGNSRISFEDVPAEYKEFAEILDKDKNYKIFYYPLKDPVINEKYIWNSKYDMNQPFISNYTSVPDNIDTTVDVHPFNIELIISPSRLKIRPSKDYETIVQSLGAMGFKYFVIRKDLLPEYYGEDATVNMGTIKDEFAKNNVNPIFENNYFEVYEIPANYFVPIISSSDYEVISKDRGFNKILLRSNNSDTEFKTFKINIKKVRKHWVVRKPVFNNELGLKLLTIDPLIFGTKVNFETKVCDYRDLPVPGHANDFGNCFVVNDSDHGHLLVEFYPDIVNKYLKIISVVLGLILIFKFDMIYSVIRLKIMSFLKR